MTTRHPPARTALDELKAEAVRRFGDLAAAVLRTVDRAAAFGETLIALKERMPHGSWVSWFEATFPVSIDTAQRWMKLAGEWPRLKPALEADPRLTVNGAIKLLRLQGPRAQSASTAAVLQALQAMAPALARQGDQGDQGHCFAFQGGLVWACSDEVVACCPSPFGEEVAGAVPGQRLIDILRCFRDADVHFSIRPGRLVLKAGLRRAELVMNPDVTLPVDSIALPRKWLPVPPDFWNAVNLVGRCTSQAKEGHAPIEELCVHVTPRWVEAYSSHQIARWRMKVPVAGDVLIRYGAAKHVEPLGMTEMAETDAWVWFKNEAGLRLGIRRYVENYDPLDEHLDVKNTTSLRWPPGVAAAARAATVFTRDDPAGPELEVVIDRGKLTIKGDGPSGSFRRRFKLTGYDGERLSFLIDPALLADIVGRYAEVAVNPERLKVTGKRWVYVVALGVPEEKYVKVTADVEEESDEEPAGEDLEQAE
jgi:hypothetical protein